MRVITVELKVEQPEANWLWDAIRIGAAIHGCKVVSISDGTLLEQLDDETPTPKPGGEDE